jgi:hypothetical protein
MNRTRDEILAEAEGDVYLALSIACGRLDWTMPRISAGYLRADTSRLKWQPKPPPSSLTSDEWIGSPAKPE